MPDEPSFVAASTMRRVCRIVSSMAVPSARRTSATTVPSSTRGRISRGSRMATSAVTITSPSAKPKTARGCPSDQSIPCSYQRTGAGIFSCVHVVVRARARDRIIITGISVRASTSDAASDITTLSERSRKSAAARPRTKTIGPKTRSVVSVPAMSGPLTSSVARRAASIAGTPSSRYLPVASATTMALSTSRPTPSARPPRERMLIVTSRSWRITSAISTDSGTISPMASDARQSLRKKRITSSERMPPAMISWVRLPRASFTNRAWAATTCILTSGNSSSSWLMDW